MAEPTAEIPCEIIEEKNENLASITEAPDDKGAMLIKLIKENSGSLGMLAFAMTSWAAETGYDHTAPVSPATAERIRNVTERVRIIRKKQANELGTVYVEEDDDDI